MELTDILEELNLDLDLDGQIDSVDITKELFEEEMGDPAGEALCCHDFDSYDQIRGC